MNAGPLFPPSYQPWLGTRLPGSRRESLATCDACAMIEPHGQTRDRGPFEPTLKCCTYFPFVPNFSLGAMLKHEPAATRVRLTVAAERGLLLPLGLFASPEQEALANDLGEMAFGREAKLLCPFFDSTANGCSTWAYRPGVCASYFCRSETDQIGFQFWADIETYLNNFEWMLAIAAATHLDFDGDLPERCEAVMLTEPGQERSWLSQTVWQSWTGREFEYYENCLTVAEKFEQSEIDEWLGSDLLELEASLRARSLVESK